MLLPFLAFVVAIVLLWNTYVDWSDLAVLAIMYVLTGYGVTLGFHRLLTHRSFQTLKPIEYALAGLGSMAVQGPVMTWVAARPRRPGAAGALRLADGLTGALWGGSAVHGLRWWELDPTAWMVRAMKRLRLAWNVVEITPERQRQKLA